MKEPTHIKGLRGRYWLLNHDVVVSDISFAKKVEAEEWGRWANFGKENLFSIIQSPSIKSYPRSAPSTTEI